MGLIPDRIIDDVQRATDIVALVQSYFPLKRAGINFKACCPFHSEKTPSFVVTPSKQIYHCFGCGTGGNVFHFLMAMEKLNFGEAVRELAQKAGIAIPVEKAEPANPFQTTYYELNQSAANYYAAQLKRHKPAFDYLAGRGLKKETIELFQLGYAPNSWDELMQAAAKKGFTPQQLAKAGLAVEGRSGWHDRFVNRILFPILDVKGRVVAFGGRAMSDEQQPKYLNSAETDYFKKGKMLYGLNFTKNDIVRENQALVLEGYMDLIGLYQAGIKNCVATLGTALTLDHVRALTRFAEEIIISYDGDKAGVDASLRGIDLFVQESCQVRILILPQGFDPDDYVLKNGAEAFKSLVKSAPYFLDYKLEKLCEEHNPATPYGQRDIARAMLSLVGKMGDEVLRSAWVRKCAERLRLSEDVLRKELAPRTDAPATAPTGASGRETASLLSVEAEVVRWLIEDPKIAPEAAQRLKPEDFEDPALREIFGRAVELQAQGAWNGVSSLLAATQDPAAVSRLTGLAAQPLVTGNLQREFSAAANRLKRISLERQIRALTEEVANRERSRGEVGGLLQEILEKRRLLEKMEI